MLMICFRNLQGTFARVVAVLIIVVLSDLAIFGPLLSLRPGKG